MSSVKVMFFITVALAYIGFSEKKYMQSRTTKSGDIKTDIISKGKIK